MIGSQILCILQTFGPLSSKAFMSCPRMKRDTVRNNLCRMKRRNEVRSIPGYQKRNMWDVL